MKKEIFDPLEMNTTKFYLTDDKEADSNLWINNGSLKGYTNDLDELTEEVIILAI